MSFVYKIVYLSPLQIDNPILRSLKRSEWQVAGGRWLPFSQGVVKLGEEIRRKKGESSSPSSRGSFL